MKYNLYSVKIIETDGLYRIVHYIDEEIIYEDDPIEDQELAREHGIKSAYNYRLYAAVNYTILFVYEVDKDDETLFSWSSSEPYPY